MRFLRGICIYDKERICMEDLYEKNNETIEIQFKRVMKKEIRDIEKDIQDIS